MPTSLTSKGQVTIPKRIRDAMRLGTGSAVDFSVNERGQVVLEAADVHDHGRARGTGKTPATPKDRFERVRGSADIVWRTDALMKLLRSEV